MTHSVIEVDAAPKDGRNLFCIACHRQRHRREDFFYVTFWARDDTVTMEFPLCDDCAETAYFSLRDAMGHGVDDE